MGDENYYDLLGVGPNATLREIKQAYYRLARQYHPDAGGENTTVEHFQCIIQAYLVLSDSEKRREYDLAHGIDIERQRSKIESRIRRPGEIPRERFSPGSAEDDSAARIHAADRAWNFLNSEEGRSVSGFNPSRFAGLKSSPGDGTSFKERFKRALDVLHQAWRILRGTVEKRSQLDLSAAEILRGERRYLFTIDALESLTGTVRELAVLTSSGPQIVQVEIDPGIAHGAVLEVKCPGHDPHHIVHIDINIVSHPFVQREGNDVLLRLPITIPEALNGTEIEIPVVGGTARVRIPPGFSSTKKLRLKGKGVRGVKRPGDLYVQPVIVPPEVLNTTVRDAASALESAYTSDVRCEFPKKF